MRPSSARITFCALMSRCRSPAAWTAASARAISTPMCATSFGVKVVPDSQQVLEGAAVHELHPESDYRQRARRREW